MIISSRRRSGTAVGRFLSLFRRSSKPRLGEVLDENEFQYEIKKERSRVDRRNGEGEFALVFVDWLKARPKNIDSLLIGFSERLRITDSVGWKDKRVTLLLPETDREGAARVANEVAKVALLHEQRVDTKILIYPWDDSIACLLYTSDAADE